MNNLEHLQHNPPCPVIGDFRIRGAEFNETRNGQQYMRFFLEDMSGSIPAYIWKEEIYRDLYLPNFAVVRIAGNSRHLGEFPRVDIQAIEPVHHKHTKDAIRLIPISFCPLHGLLADLQGLINRLSIRPLRQFVEEVLADDGIAFPFVSAPASLNHHHCYPGGLLAHSLECTSLIERHREFNRTSHELGLVAALFHDIGKILTMTSQMQRTTLGQSIDHDKMTLELLAPFLKQLQSDWPQGAIELRYLLTWKLRKPVPRYNVADMVACSDRISAGLDMEKRRA